MAVRRLGSGSAYLAAGLGAVVVGVFGTVLLLLLVVGKKADADPAKARGRTAHVEHF